MAQGHAHRARSRQALRRAALPGAPGHLSPGADGARPGASGRAGLRDRFAQHHLRRAGRGRQRHRADGDGLRARDGRAVAAGAADDPLRAGRRAGAGRDVEGRGAPSGGGLRHRGGHLPLRRVRRSGGRAHVDREPHDDGQHGCRARRQVRLLRRRRGDARLPGGADAGRGAALRPRRGRVLRGDASRGRRGDRAADRLSPQSGQREARLAARRRARAAGVPRLLHERAARGSRGGRGGPEGPPCAPGDAADRDPRLATRGPGGHDGRATRRSCSRPARTSRPRAAGRAREGTAG